MYSTLLSSDVMHLAAARASSGYFVKAPMPRLMPPSGGVLICPAAVAG